MTLRVPGSFAFTKPVHGFLVGGFMPITECSDVAKILQWFSYGIAGYHLTPECADKLKEHIDLLTD